MGQKITLKGLLALLCFAATSTGAFAQSTVTKISAVSNTSNTPISTLTQRRSIKITGTGFGTTTNTTVRFYTTTDNATTSTAYVTATPSAASSTELTIVVPRVIAAGSANATLSFRVYVGSTPSSPFSYTYVPPATTVAATAGITELVTNWNAGNNQGYWRSSSASSTANQQPDNFHSIMGFRYGGKLYSTGSESTITNVLNTAGLTSGAGTGTTTYLTGNFRALPIRNLSGPTGPSTSAGGNPNLIALGKLADGNANGWNPTAPTVAGLSVKDVLIDGIRGLGIGSGVTNLPSTSILEFEAQGIVNNTVITDDVPDILVSQIAVPSSSADGVNAYSVYCFTDANGDIVGKPMQIALADIAAVGRYKVDFYNLNGAQLNTALLNQGTTVSPETRDIRLVGYRLTEFGITDTNRGSVAKFVVMPSGTSDPAFMAYNRDAFNIPAPEITTQPTSVAKCPGEGATFSVSVASTSTGTETPTYQWEKNGVELSNTTTAWGSVITGATSATLNITNIAQQDYGLYRCVVTNSTGSAFSNGAYLNTVSLYTSPATTTCINTPVTIEATTAGNTPQYRWYVNTTNSTTGGTLIANQTASSYSPPVNEAGIKYYYSQSYPAGSECAVTTSAVIPVTVTGAANAGTITANQSICPGTPGTVTLTGYTGTIQWQSTTSSDGTGWANISGATAASYTNPSVFGITYYRAIVTSGTCGTATSGTSSLTAATAYLWTGNTNRDWNVANNWSCNEIPNDTIDVIIPAEPVNQPIVYNNGTAFARTLTLNTNSSLAIQTGATLSVVNDVAALDNAAFTIENNGALVQVNNMNNNGTATVKKDSWSLFRLDYTMWSSPVSGQNILAFSPATTLTRFYEYNYGVNSSNQPFEGYFHVDAANTSFARGKGYLIRMPSSDATSGYNQGTARITHHGVFTGTLYNGTITYPLSTQGYRYTAVGNPYASPINISDFLTQNAGVLDEGSGIYLWRKKNDTNVSSYVTITGASYTTNDATSISSGIATPGYTYGGQEQASYYTGNGNTWTLAQGQGFIVRTKTGVTSPQVTFNNSIRRQAATSGDQAFFRQAQSSTSRLWLNIADAQGGISQTSVAYMEGGTLELDFGLDARSFGDSGTSLYTLAGEEELAIQARPEFDATDILPLGFNAVAAGSYTITLDHTDGVFAQDQDIFIVDKVLNTTTQLTETEAGYTFTTEAGQFNNRFDIVYKNVALGTNNPTIDANTVIAYKNGNNININSGTALMNSVRVFDINGRQLYYGDNINAVETQISGLTIEQQVIIVEINTDKGRVNKKLVF